MITTDWAAGFLAGIRLRRKLWDSRHDKCSRILPPFIAALLQTDKLKASFQEAEVDVEEAFKFARDNISEILHELYKIAAANVPEHHNGTVTYHEKKAGRNDPCPCGSGKKYKKCCLN